MRDKGAYMVKGASMVLQGACMACAWQGECVAGGGVHGKEYVW